MIDPELKAELERIEGKVDQAYKAANQVRQWIKWTAIITAVLIVAPLLFLPFAVNSLLSTYTEIQSF